jgi:hypothetical protein
MGLIEGLSGRFGPKLGFSSFLHRRFSRGGVRVDLGCWLPWGLCLFLRRHRHSERFNVNDITILVNFID